MSQPPYPPPGGDDPAGQRPAQQGWGQPDDSGQHAGQPQYGHPQYGHPQYGRPYLAQPGGYVPGQQYGQQYGQQPPKSRSSVVIALTVGEVLVLAGLAVGLVLLLRGDDSGTTAADPTRTGSSSSSGSTTAPGAGGVPPATVPPTGLGSDAALDAQARDCYGGDMTACDDLFFASDVGSRYERYADTCAGRQPEGTGELCSVTFPE